MANDLTQDVEALENPDTSMKTTALSLRQGGGLVRNSFDQVLRMRSVARHASIVHLAVIPVGKAADFR